MSKFLSLPKGLAACGLALAMAGCAGMEGGVEPPAQMHVPVRKEVPFSASVDGPDARDRALANAALSEAPADARLIALNEDVPPVGPALRSGRDDGLDARDREQSLLAAPNGVRP